MKLSPLFASLLLTSASAAFASNITYSLTENAGNATAIGTITTDGKIGTLSQSDLVSYTFTITKGSASETFTEPGSHAVFAGGDLAASASGLSFNFGDVSGDVSGFILGDASNSSMVCMINADTMCNGFSNYPNGGGVVIVLNGVESQSAGLFGDPQFASASATPEPSSLVLLGTGLLSAAGAARRRFRKI